MKNMICGIRPDVPDLLIILPIKKLLFVEMKRSVFKHTSPEQIKWTEELNEYKGVIAVEADGFEDDK
jgi:hypothetical protein